MAIANRGLIPVFAAVAILAGGQAAFAGENLVDYRLTEWKSAHFNSPDKAAEFQAALKNLGCETAQKPHGNHIDVAYRCPEWQRLNAPSHASAHRWESWLKSRGFETMHRH